MYCKSVLLLTVVSSASASTGILYNNLFGPSRPVLNKINAWAPLVVNGNNWQQPPVYAQPQSSFGQTSSTSSPMFGTIQQQSQYQTQQYQNQQSQGQQPQQNQHNQQSQPQQQNQQQIPPTTVTKVETKEEVIVDPPLLTPRLPERASELNYMAATTEY